MLKLSHRAELVKNGEASKGCLSCSKNALKFRIYGAGPHESAFLSLGLLISKAQFKADRTSKLGYSAIFLSLCFLFSKTQFTTDVASKSRIVLKKILVDIF